MKLAIGFTDATRSFTNGFEAGMIYEKMQAGERVIDQGIAAGFPIHAENVELFKRMAQAEGYALEVVPTDTEGWVAVRFTCSSKPRPALSVIKP
jgi:hypothetical protein